MFPLPFILPSILTGDTTDKPTVNLYASLRERYESRQNPTFSSAASKNMENLYSRLRVGVAYDSKAKLMGRIEYQNAQDLYWNDTQNSNVQSSDLSLAYLKYSTGGLTATGGRQKIDLGQQRLIGSAEWLNLARSFDAGKVDFGQWYGWAGRLGVANTKPEPARIEDLTHTDKNWGTTSLIEKHDLGTVSTTDEQTLDHFVTRTFGKTTFDGEAAIQYGSNNGRDQRAWAWHIRAAQPILPKTTLSVEGNAASGGGNSSTSRNFDNLYPSNHDMYGLADLVGWKNMNELAIKLEHKLTKSLTLNAEAHALSLRDPSAGWYSATGVLNSGPNGSLVDPTGSSGVDLGREYDLMATYSANHIGTFMAGVAFFEPGNYVQAVGGSSSQLIYGYLQYQTRF